MPSAKPGATRFAILETWECRNTIEGCAMKFSGYLFGFYLVISLLGSSVVAQQQPTSPSIAATVPRLVNFTGKTSDAQGKLIAGIAGVTFAIYKEQYEGAPLWLEAQNIQADAKGNYTVQLGATKPEGLPLDLFSSGDDATRVVVT